MRQMVCKYHGNAVQEELDRLINDDGVENTAQERFKKLSTAVRNVLENLDADERERLAKLLEEDKQNPIAPEIQQRCVDAGPGPGQP